MLVISIFVLVTELVSLYQMSLAWYFLGTSRSLGSSLFHYVIYSKVDWRFQVLPYIRMATAATTQLSAYVSGSLPLPSLQPCLILLDQGGTWVPLTSCYFLTLRIVS